MKNREQAETVDRHPTAVECPKCYAWEGFACEGTGYGYHAAGYHRARKNSARLADVAELLRCAADYEEHGGLMGLAVASWFLGMRSEKTGAPITRVVRMAEQAFHATPVPKLRDGTEVYRVRALEAAQRVEEGSWP